MSTELLLQKIGVAILLLSVLPGIWWGWRFTRNEELIERIFITFLFGLMPPCIIGCVALLGVLLGQALLFVLT